MLEVDSAFARQGWRRCSGSMIIELERRVQDLKCWKIRTLQMCNIVESVTLIADVCIFNRDDVFMKHSREKLLLSNMKLKG